MSRPPLALVATAIVIALATLLPVFFVARQAIDVGRDEAIRLLWRPRVGMLLSNTLRLTFAVTIICAIVGFGVAWLVERTDLPGRRGWAVLAALPLTIPAFIASYSWVSLTPHAQGFGGAILVNTLTNFPLVYLPVAAVFRAMDPRLEECGRALGLNPVRAFLRVVLPQARPALLGGCLLVAVHVLGEFGALAMLRFPTFTTAIYDQYRLTFDGPAGSLLAAVLVVCFLPFLIAEPLARGSARDGRFGGADRGVVRYRLRKATPLALLAMMVLTVLALGVPFVTIGYWLTRGRSAAIPVGDLVATTWDTVRLSAAAAGLTTLLAVPIAVVVVRYRSPLATLLERSTYVATSLPAIAISLTLSIVTIQIARPLYQSTFLLLIAYAISTLPLALVAVRAAIARVPRSLEEAARTLGARPSSVFVRVTLPLIAPGLGAAALLVFLTVVTELTATLLLAPIGTETLAMRVWENTATLSYGAAAPYAVVMVVTTILPAYLLMSRLGAARTETQWA